MKLGTTRALLVAAAVVFPHGSFSQGLEAVRPIPGYGCMLLTERDIEAKVQSELPPVLAAPSPLAEQIGYPSEIIFVKLPLHEVGGYVEMLRLNGQTGWIDANHLRPWHAMNNRKANCVPSYMSDGGLGTKINHLP